MAVSASAPVFKNSIARWIDYRLPIFAFMHHQLDEYPTQNYWWILGSLVGITLVIMILAAITVAMHYTPEANFAFASVEHIMRDVNYGWLIRYLHTTSASMFFTLVYLHLARGSTTARTRRRGSCSGSSFLVLLPLVGVLETPAPLSAGIGRSEPTREHTSPAPTSEGVSYGMQVLKGCLKSGARTITVLTLALVGARPVAAETPEARVPSCLACHGEQGTSTNPEVPSLGLKRRLTWKSSPISIASK